MQKKQIITLLCNSLLLICITACHHNTPKTGEMSAEDAIELLDARIRKDSKNHTLLFERAQLYMQTGRVNEAIADLTQAIKLKSNKIEYQLLLADAYFANGDVEHSYQTLDQALKTDPQNQEAILKQGEIAFYSRDYDRALTNLSTVTAKDPNNRTALFMKSFIYKEKGDTTNAILLLRKVCDIYPDYAPAFEELGILYAYHPDPLATEYLKTAIRLNPNNTN
ncbi:MAG: tetratricopeptide repeat protein, partial [Bacteroidales bacterium]|nr:tetratricopeptide repeat protein [Candidatus Colimorpha onthohippi]